MRLLDLNILIYAMDESSPRHQVARDWLDATLSGADTVRRIVMQSCSAGPLAVEQGAELCSTDVDFSRFSGVRWIDPWRDSCGVDFGGCCSAYSHAAATCPRLSLR
jgi:hypothetical protein